MDLCPHAEDRFEAAARFLTDRLEPDAAEAYERHLFSCPECAAAADQAMAIREALGVDRVGEQPQARPGERAAWSRSRPALAAAAAIATVAVGLWLALPSGRLPPSPTTRGEVEQLRVQVRAVPGEVRLSWPAHRNADRYAVRIFTSDGTLLLSRETGETRFALPLSDLPPARPLFARVEALSPVGEAVGDSGLQPLDLADAPPRP